jgi:hypothetical protein
VSGTRKTDIKKVQTKQDNFMVDEDCINNQIDLEECMIRTNGHQPCKLPEKDLSEKYQKLYNKRMEKFITILEENDYKTKKISKNDKFMELWEIVDYQDDEKYQNLVEEFLSKI